jgi:hypothetical protein
MQLDKQRIEAVRMLEGLGYAFQDGEWLPTVVAPPLPVTAEADAMHGALIPMLWPVAPRGRTKRANWRRSSICSRHTKSSAGRWAKIQTCREARVEPQARHGKATLTEHITS